MRKSELNKFDTVKATVCGKAKNNGYYLRIEELEDDVIAMVYDCALLIGWEVIVSIVRMSEDKNYILTKMDSVCDGGRVYDYGTCCGIAA